MKKVLALVLLSLTACQRDSSFLVEIPTPVPPLVIPQKPVTTTTRTTTTTTTTLQHAVKIYQLKVASTSINIPEVDILWIIDNSNSMESVQKAVIANTQLFMDNFTGSTMLKWKMGLLSTDDRDAPYLGFTPETLLNYKTSNPTKIFQAAVGKLGVEGDSYEKTYTPVLQALRGYPTFLNPKAYLALVIVTDAEEQSYYVSTQLFIDELAKYKNGNKEKIVTYGVFALSDKCGGEGFYYKNSKYQQLMQATNGKTYNLCDPKFGTLLTSISQDLIETIATLHPVIMLDKHPMPPSIKITYNGRPLKPGLFEDGGEWIYVPDKNIIRITNPAILSGKIREVRIEFDLDPYYHH